MSISARAWCSWVLPLALTTACSASPPADGKGTTPSVALTEPRVCPVGKTGATCADDVPQSPAAAAPVCALTAPPPRCDGLLGPDESKALSDAVDAAQKAVTDTRYADVRALVEVARLQLRREAELSDAEGANDAARALRNAMRAVAVASLPEARFVLALALARSIHGARSLSEPATRDLALGLVDVALRSVPASAGAVEAATKTLDGYVALERGNRAQARASFEAATRQDSQLASPWVGLGDVARSEGAFPAAEAAYKKAAALLPADAGVRAAVEAAARKEALALPAGPGASRLAITAGALAPAPPAVPTCPATATSAPAGATLCKGLADLAKATAPGPLELAAKQILQGWDALRPLCEAADPACGPHAAQAVAAASRAFFSAGQLSKSIAAGKLLLSRPELPGVSAVTPTVALEVADRYFALGIFDTAADHYAQHFKLQGEKAAEAAERALAIRIALTNVDAATKLAATLAMDSHHPAARRASWVLPTATLVRAVKGPEPATQWLQKYRQLFDQAGMTAAMAEVGKPVSETAPSAVPCAALLPCAVRRLAGEGRWSRKSVATPSPAPPPSP